MTVAELKFWLEERGVPEDAEIAFVNHFGEPVVMGTPRHSGIISTAFWADPDDHLWYRVRKEYVILDAPDLGPEPW